MRKVLLTCLVAAVAVLLLLVLCAYWGSQMIGGLFGPDVATDAQARERIQTMGVAIPEGAQDLYYCRLGFEEPFIYIGVTIPAEARAKIIDEWLGVDHTTLKPIAIEDAHAASPEALTKTAKTGRWDHTAMRKPVCYMQESDPRPLGDSIVYDCRRVVIYDAGGERVLLFYWHE